jgi:hypothetical protein
MSAHHDPLVSLRADPSTARHRSQIRRGRANVRRAPVVPASPTSTVHDGRSPGSGHASMQSVTTGGVDLYWIPLGAGVGGALVRWSGRAYEAVAAASERRPRRALFHSALMVRVDETAAAIEMAPVWTTRSERGVVAEGPVGARALGRWRLFRYEVRCWPDGSIPDIAAAVDGPVRVSDDAVTAQRILGLAAQFPVHTWGRDEQDAGEMWNSNSLTSWLLARAGIPTDGLRPPAGGRAPGWDAGLAIAWRGDDPSGR